MHSDYTTQNFPVRQQFRLHTLDLNSEMLELVADDPRNTESSSQDKEMANHWLFSDPLYAPRVQDLVKAAREVVAAAGETDDRSDHQLAACMLKTHGLWDLPKPVGFRSHTRYLASFLTAYGRLYMRAQQLKMEMPPSIHQHGQAGHA